MMESDSLSSLPFKQTIAVLQDQVEVGHDVLVSFIDVEHWSKLKMIIFDKNVNDFLAYNYDLRV